jgi:hypothetical protein
LENDRCRSIWCFLVIIGAIVYSMVNKTKESFFEFKNTKKNIARPAETQKLNGVRAI